MPYTFKFLGLAAEDAPTPHYYGTVPAEPEIGHILVFEETRNRYTVVRIEGEGLSGKGSEAQEELAWADMIRGEKVPTLVLKKVRKATITRQFRKDAIRAAREMPVRGQSFEYEELKERSQRNKIRRFRRPE
jgi:hypothetical protein